MSQHSLELLFTLAFFAPPAFFTALFVGWMLIDEFTPTRRK